MVEDASAMLAERRSGTLPAHILEGVLLEPELFCSFGRSEQLLYSPVGHVVPQSMELGGKCGKAWPTGSVELCSIFATPQSWGTPSLVQVRDA